MQPMCIWIALCVVYPNTNLRLLNPFVMPWRQLPVKTPGAPAFNKNTVRFTVITFFGIKFYVC